VSLNVLFVSVAASRSVVIVRPARRGQQQKFDKANWKAAVVYSFATWVMMFVAC
jgi:hypothetical protein